MYVSFVRLLVYHVQEQQHALVATADIIYKTECVSQIARWYIMLTLWPGSALYRLDASLISQ